tara:strand:+ start:1739 stop:2341 length:603 start_codon:yes stop_codon:yes gene_type:complete
MTTATQTFEDYFETGTSHAEEVWNQVLEGFSNLLREFRNEDEDPDRKQELFLQYRDIMRDFKNTLLESLDRNSNLMKIADEFGTHWAPLWLKDLRMQRRFYIHCFKEETQEAKETLEEIREFQLEQLDNCGKYYPLEFILFCRKRELLDDLSQIHGTEYGQLLYSKMIRRDDSVDKFMLKNAVNNKIFFAIAHEFIKSED